MEDLDIEALKNAWFSYEEIQSIIRWNTQVNNWFIYNEEEFYSRLEKRIYSKERSYV